MSRLAILIAAGLALSGCGAGGTPQNSTATTAPPEKPFSASAADLADEARSEGASVEQLAIIETATKSGSVTRDDLADAAARAVECMRTAGLFAQTVDDVRPYGVTVPGYQAGSDELPDSTVLDLIDACDKEHYYFAAYLYQTQPSTLAARDEHFASHRGAIVACLETHGVAVDPEAPPDAVMAAANELLAGPPPSGPPEDLVASESNVTTDTKPEEGPDCLAEAGW